MDVSANIYDLQFLTNPNLINKITNDKMLCISPEDIKFYKKRIFMLTKNYLKGKKRDRDLDKILLISYLVLNNISSVSIP